MVYVPPGGTRCSPRWNTLFPQVEHLKQPPRSVHHGCLPPRSPRGSGCRLRRLGRVTSNTRKSVRLLGRSVRTPAAMRASTPRLAVLRPIPHSEANFRSDTVSRQVAKSAHWRAWRNTTSPGRGIAANTPAWMMSETRRWSSPRSWGCLASLLTCVSSWAAAARSLRTPRAAGPLLA